MIQAASTSKDGTRLYLIGISELMLTRLRTGQPVEIDLKPLGGEATVIIFHGYNEQIMSQQLTQLVNAGTALLNE
jgi:hypothetical protein